MDPEEDKHPKFSTVASVELTLFPRDNQTTSGTMIKMTVREAVEKKVIAGENLGYFLARTQRFLMDMGAQVSPVKQRKKRSFVFFISAFLPPFPSASRQRNGALCGGLLGCGAAHHIRMD